MAEWAEHTNDFHEPDDSMPEENKNPQRVKLLNVRCSFPNLVEAREFQGKRQYNITVLIPKSDAKQLAAINAALAATMLKCWPVGGTYGNGGKIVKITKENQKPNAEDICLQDGDLKTTDGYAGCRYIHAKANVGYEPKVIDQYKRPITSDNVIYGGCYVNVILDFWGWYYGQGKAGHERGISATIVAVQFAADGERFGGGAVDVDAEFDAIATDGFDEGDGFRATGTVGLDPSKPIGSDEFAF